MRRVALLLVLSGLVACGPGSPSTDGSGSSSGSDPGSTSDASTTDRPSTTAPPSTTTTTNGTGEPTSQPADDSGSTTDQCTSVCIAHFPCAGWEPRCVDALTIEIWHELPCEEVCGYDCPCDGASCEPDHDEPCEPGMLCLETYRDYVSLASCAPIDTLCGGPDGLACEAGQWCEYDLGMCPECLTDPAGCGLGSPVGLCVDQPPVDARCPAVDEEGDPRPPQCGCDGITYANECERRRAGIALGDVGPCKP